MQDLYNPNLPYAAPPEAEAVEPAEAPDTRVYVDWNKKRFEVVCTQYIDSENTCIVLLNLDTGVIEAKASTNLAKLPPYRTFIKDYSENRGIAAALTARRLIRKVGNTIRNGSEDFEEYEILPRLGKHFGIELPEALPEVVLDPELAQTIPAEIQPEKEDDPDSPSNMSEFDQQAQANLIQKAKDLKAEEEQLAEDALR